MQMPTVTEISRSLQPTTADTLPHESEAEAVLEACQQSLERLTDDVAAHERQRALVCASLLSRRENPSTHRRSA
jgi:hypothetical protein